MTLADIIIENIRFGGPMSFRDFMSMALYHEPLGYYTSPSKKIGDDGDYYTSPELCGLFSQLLARQLEEMWCLTGQQDFNIIEFGAGGGALCEGILLSLQDRPIYDRLQYSIIERSATQCKRAKARLTSNVKVKWYDNLDEITLRTGCIISNEVVDNFPVHRVVMHEQLMEVCVGYSNTFFEYLLPAPEKLSGYLQRHAYSLALNEQAEVNIDASVWIKKIADFLEKGFILTIDYGKVSSQRRPGGNSSIRCYHRQTVNGDPYANIGQQDITCDVNFSFLHNDGLENGLSLVGFCNQALFLRSLGLVDCIRQLEAGSKRNPTTHVMTLLNEMGDKFKVLIQSKNMSPTPLLGMQLAASLR